MAEIEKKKKKGVQAIIWRDNSDRYRMLVCQKFLTGHCTLTTCPLAHPGVRDAAPVSRTNNDFILPPVDMSEPRTSYKPLFLYSFIPFSFYTFTLSPFHPFTLHPFTLHPFTPPKGDIRQTSRREQKAPSRQCVSRLRCLPRHLRERTIMLQVPRVRTALHSRDHSGYVPPRKRTLHILRSLRSLRSINVTCHSPRQVGRTPRCIL